MTYKLDIELSKALEPYRSVIEATIKPYIKIELTDNDKPTWWQSKFGGLPYMPKNFDYPKSNAGEYLYLLAQINFAEVLKLEGLPEQGILQFYLATDEDFYGCDFNNSFNQDKFRVVYFPEINLKIDNLLTDFSFLPELESEDWLMPFQGCCCLNFELAYSPVSLSDAKFNIFPEYSDRYDIPDKLFDSYDDAFCLDLHKIGGYPNFIQQDPRSNFPEDSLILLFQIGSDRSQTIDIMWADGGIGNFFIKRLRSAYPSESHLEKLDFTQVLYNWDCG